MVDDVNPTTQFHPYRAPDAVPQSEARKSDALTRSLKRLGIDQNQLDAVRSRLNGPNITAARTWARNHGGLALGGLAVAVIGAGLLARRSHR